MLHFTTCWCVLPSTDMEVWQTRQLMTGALLLSGLPCGEYGGGGSPGATELGNGAKPDEDEEEEVLLILYLLTLIKQHLLFIIKKYRKYIAWSTASPTHYIYSCSAMRTHAMKLPAHSFCADINALMRFGALQFMSQQSLLCTLALGDPALLLYIGLTFWDWAAVAPKLFHFGIILLSPNESKKCNEFVAVVESYSVSSLKGPIPKPNICKGRLLGSALLETCETKTLEFKD